MKSLWRYLPQWAKQCPQMLTDILVVTMAFHHYIICYSVQFLNCFIIMMKLIMIPASKNISWFLFLFLFYLNGASLQSSSGPIFHIRPNESCGHGPSGRHQLDWNRFRRNQTQRKDIHCTYMFATTTEYFLMNCNRSNSGIKHRQRRVFRVFLIFLR